MDREGCRSPAGTGCMTGLARSWYTKRSVIGVDRLIVIGLVTTYAGVGRIVVISSRVTTVAVYSCMGACQLVIIIVNGKGRRGPAGAGRMTGLAGGRYAKRSVIGVDRLVVISLVTTYAGVGSIVVIPARVTTVAVGRSMSSG